MKTEQKIRPAMVAGMFYSGGKNQLIRDISNYLEQAPVLQIPGRILGVVAPHAGYIYSAQVSAYAYKQIAEQEINLVAVIAPSHREYFTEISVYDGFAYETPLGFVPVDREKAAALADISPQIMLSEKGHRFEEHSLEVQLPFLQTIIKSFHLLPIVIGEQNQNNIEILADGLSQILKGQNSLIVASSDLSHFYSAKKAKILDTHVIEDIENFDEDSLQSHISNGSCEMCGGGPVLATMKACRQLGATYSKVTRYRTSGDVTGEFDEVVGYLSAVFSKS